MKKIVAHFRDSFTFDAVQKTAISVRDGVIEYYGQEIGMTPADKLFKVYRSPATIANAAVDMQGIPLTVDHVNVDMPVTNACGSVLTSRMIDLKSDEMGSTVGILNSLDVMNDQIGVVATGKRELSLGYRATLVEMPPESGYDFEQRDIAPHHLAIVDAGRCGSVCSFIDHKASEGIQDMTKKTKPKLHKAFKDAEGQPSLSGIVDIVNALPDAIASLPLDEAQKVMPILQGIVEKNAAAATEGAGEGDDETVTDEDGENKDGEETTDAEMTPEEKAAKEKADKEAQAATDAEGKDKEKPFGDAKAFKDAVANGVQEHMAIVDRARAFLPDNYIFKGKTGQQIMRDAVATEHGKQKFSDSELNVAFKLLKKTESKYKDFGDGMTAGGKFTTHVKQ